MTAIQALCQKLDNPFAQQWAQSFLLPYEGGEQVDQHSVYEMEEDLLLQPWPQILTWLDKRSSPILFTSKEAALASWQAEQELQLAGEWWGNLAAQTALLENAFDWHTGEANRAFALSHGEWCFTHTADEYWLAVFRLQNFLFRVSFQAEDGTWIMDWDSLQAVPHHSGLFPQAIALVKTIMASFIRLQKPQKLALQGVVANRSQYYASNCPEWAAEWAMECTINWQSEGEMWATFTHSLS